MFRIVHGAGALALSGAGAAMTAAAAAGIGRAIGGAEGALVAGGLLVVAVAALGPVAVRETRMAVRATGLRVTRTDLGNAAAVATAAPITYLLSVEVGLGAVVASALVGLCAHLVWETRGAAAYCGSFVGMATPAAGADLAAVGGAGVAAAAVFVAAKRAFDGFGGKLGTTALVGCLSVAAVGWLVPGSGSTPSPTVAAAVVGVAAVAAVAAFVASVRLDRGPVVGSAVVGLVAGLCLPPLFPAGGTLAAAAFCASFTGMAAPERIPGTGAMLVAGVVTGVVFVGAAPFAVGFGGKLGTIAFAACLVTRGAVSAADAVAPAPVGRVSG